MYFIGSSAEKQLKKKWLIGIDEAGRGPLAGPVSVALVGLPQRRVHAAFRGLKDSKHLSAKKRKEWMLEFRNHPEIVCVSCFVGSKIIDRIGIAKAVKTAIHRILRKTFDGSLSGLRRGKLRLLLDGGLRAPDQYHQRTIIKGDEKIDIIAAASVIAKVSRDEKMIRLAKKFPDYAFEIHKGYGTKLHYKLLKEHGSCAIHRRTFL